MLVDALEGLNHARVYEANEHDANEHDDHDEDDEHDELEAGDNTNNDDEDHVDDGNDDDVAVANPVPPFCVKCGRPLRPCAAMQCKKCNIWLHASCMSTSSSGRCSFCP